MNIPRLHPDTIEQVKQRADIVDIISEHVVLRKRGKDYVGLCPFHEEKSPSFTVSPTKQMYYCFGCGAGGHAIKFLTELGKRSFADVVLDLARRYQVPVQTLEPEQRQELQRQISLREQLYEILALAARFYEHALRQPQGEQALKYLQSSRRLNEKTIQQFQLGYAPSGWETLYRYLIEQKRCSVQLVEQAGLIRRRQSGDGYYDYFRDRIIIPIHDTQGRVIGFGGRTLTSEEPKYLNSPETQLFNKGKTLFALDKARDAILKQDQGVVVEGYFDAIALHAAGISNTVASLGTALSLDQVRQLLRFSESKQLVLNFDADTAGNNAAERAIGEIADLAYRGEIQLRVLNIPDGKDADEFLKTADDASDKYRELLNNAPLWLDWQIQRLCSGKNLKQAEKYQQVFQQMVKLLAQIASSDVRTYYIRQCAAILSQGETRLVPMLADDFLAQLKKPSQREPAGLVTRRLRPAQPPPHASENNRLEQAEALLLRLHLHCPYQRQEVIDALEARDLLFCFPHHRFLWQQILAIQEASTGIQLDLISKLQDRTLDFPTEMAQVAHLFHLDENTERVIIPRAFELIQAAAVRIEQVKYEIQYRLCLDDWQKIDRAVEPERWRRTYQEFHAAKRRSMELERECQISLSDLVAI